jgi:hypothetical protein
MILRENQRASAARFLTLFGEPPTARANRTCRKSIDDGFHEAYGSCTERASGPVEVSASTLCARGCETEHLGRPYLWLARHQFLGPLLRLGQKRYAWLFDGPCDNTEDDSVGHLRLCAWADERFLSAPVTTDRHEYSAELVLSSPRYPC